MIIGLSISDAITETGVVLFIVVIVGLGLALWYADRHGL
jgi:hypothetical protein